MEQDAFLLKILIEFVKKWIFGWICEKMKSIGLNLHKIECKLSEYQLDLWKSETQVSVEFVKVWVFVELVYVFPTFALRRNCWQVFFTSSTVGSKQCLYRACPRGTKKHTNVHWAHSCYRPQTQQTLGCHRSYCILSASPTASITFCCGKVAGSTVRKALTGLMSKWSKWNRWYWWAMNGRRKNVPIQQWSFAYGWTFTTSGGSTPEFKHTISATCTVFDCQKKNRQKQRNRAECEKFDKSFIAERVRNTSSFTHRVTPFERRRITHRGTLFEKHGWIRSHAKKKKKKKIMRNMGSLSVSYALLHAPFGNFLFGNLLRSVSLLMKKRQHLGASLQHNLQLRNKLCLHGYACWDWWRRAEGFHLENHKK